MNRTGCRPAWPSDGSPGTRACSSVPNAPAASSLAPPASATAVAISCRTSSHSPSLFGAANACSWSELTPCTMAMSGPCSSEMFSWISKPSPTGTSRLPKSMRSAAGMSSSASQGPAAAGLAGRLVVLRGPVFRAVLRLILDGRGLGFFLAATPTEHFRSPLVSRSAGLVLRPGRYPRAARLAGRHGTGVTAGRAEAVSPRADPGRLSTS